MNPSRALAEQTVEALWRDGCGCVLIEATPMRPGRGGSAGHHKGRRRVGRREHGRFEDLVGSVVGGLRSGLLTPAMTRHRVDEAGWDEFVRVADTREGAAEAIAGFFELGYHPWNVDEGTEDCALEVLRIVLVTRRELT